QTRTRPHEISITQTRNFQGWRTLTFSSPQLLAGDRVSRRKLAAEMKVSLAAQAGLSWQAKVDDTTGSITMSELRDPLEDMLTISDFRQQYPLGDDPATSWKSFKVAITERLDPVE